jgi:ferredoxin--NADP+ reductase
VYVAGWLKRGPQGVIADNRWDAQETAAALVEDLPQLPPHRWYTAADDPLNIFSDRVEFSDWLRLDDAERSRGEPLGKPREKFTSIAAMRAALASD